MTLAVSTAAEGERRGAIGGPICLSELRAEDRARLPDLGKALVEAPPKVKRHVFEAFGLEIRFAKTERRIEVCATVSEAVARPSKMRKTSRRRSLASLQGT